MRKQSIPGRFFPSNKSAWEWGYCARSEKLQYASKKTSHKRAVQRAPVQIKRGENGAWTGEERERPFERARVSGRQCRRPAPLLGFFRTWSAKTGLDYHLEARIPVPWGRTAISYRTRAAPPPFLSQLTVRGFFLTRTVSLHCVVIL